MLARRSLILGLSLGLWLVAVASPASALGIAGYDMQIAVQGQNVGLGDLVTAKDVGWTPATNGGTYTLKAPVSVGLDSNNQPVFSIDSWTSQVDVDPFVTNNLNVTNTSGLTQTFVITVTLPIVPQTPATAMSGSVGITLTNTTGSATLADAGTAVYTALIDGGSVQTLKNPAYTLTCIAPFCSVTDSASFGIPTPIVGPAALSTIAIRLQFTLSPGDSAGLTSVFNITAVPEPVTALMMGLGLLGLGLAGRRRA